MARLGFTKEERSRFNYWFAHWCAFNLTALLVHAWKFKYLFHDFEKPWLRLFLKYKTVQHLHRTYNKHHLEYGRRNGYHKMDWEAAVIDWECSRLTKLAQPLNARQFANSVIANKNGEYSNEDIRAIDYFVMPILDKFGL